MKTRSDKYSYGLGHYDGALDMYQRIAVVIGLAIWFQLIQRAEVEGEKA